MNIKKCPICEKIKEEKEKKIKNLSSKTYICKNHLKEAITINSQIIEILDFENNKDCPLCILEEEITQNFQGEVKDLCLYHLRMLRYRIKEEDYKEIAKKWEEYKNYLKDPDDKVELIFDLLTGCGRIIRK
ncbi:hypothetical protein [Dictyoglomus thermophilum]|uniref:Uncharacterized protein n=1 Tax=Dictyoglomus thermophilum (strain ATCC 35947 / DSM 3960 / H-6-12) TaxID=309799 RepID=B5YB34_DICT6|nr:hypothetical protein [Dictyoglomus thermophilum]ACI19447.1 conserved hypothetical protein [Dictyoglomus thermophilum H-6-12]